MPAGDSPPGESIVIFSGGIGLGAYQGGAWEALQEEQSLRPGWFAASSIGAVNAALIAGSAPGGTVESLRQFWTAGNHRPDGGGAPASAWDGERRSWNWASAVGTRLFGAPGFFYPRLPAQPLESFSSVYDLAPTRARIRQLVDFDRLNAGDIRMTIATTDIESGACVLFDTARGDRIELDHLLASCGFLPEFAPVEIGGRLLGDGGLSANAPLEPVFQEADDERTVFILDLYARDGDRPADLTEAMARRNDLLFGNQTLGRLQAYRLARAAQDAGGRGRRVFHLSYRPPRHEAGAEKPFDFSQRSIADRWEAGRLDMAEALRQRRHGRPPQDGLTLVRRT